MNISSFCLGESFSHQSAEVDCDIECENLLKKHRELSRIQFTPLQHCNALSITLAGPITTVTNARGDILKNNPIKSALLIDSPNLDALFHAEIKSHIIQIAKEYDIEIHVNCKASEPRIHLFGSINAIEVACVKLLVLLDQMAGLHTDTLEEIPYYLHFLISGRKHTQLQSIMEETSTHIYLQSPFSHLCTLTPENLHQKYGVIHVTGESATGVSRAKDLLRKLSAQKSKSMYQKSTTMDSNKIDWILLNRRTELRKIMRDNGSFFSFPALGSGNNSVSVYAENRINVERSIRLLNHLTSNIYEASFDLAKTKNIDSDELFTAMSFISQSSGVNLSFNAELSNLHLFGTERQVRSSYQILCELPLFKENHMCSMFSLELATDQREFISGKKNGKINKIMKSCGVIIRFNAANEYNSSIIVESTNHTKALDGLTMLQDELPAETSFYVPEIYHRRIIGVAGKNIQKVMKKYGVYVKFSGAEEFTALGGYFENEDNVVARTPMKNQINLQNLKHSVTEFIGFQKDKDFTSTVVDVPYTLQRVIPNKYGSQLREVCRANNAKIWWPECLGSSQVIIYGPQMQIPNVVSYLSQFISKEKHIAVALEGDDMQKILTKTSFVSHLKKTIRNGSRLELTQIAIVDQYSPEDEFLTWVSGYDTDASKFILFRLSCPKTVLHPDQEVNKASSIIKESFEDKGLQFIELASIKPIEANGAYSLLDNQQDHLIASTFTSINDDHYTPQISEDPLFSVFDQIPSPPLSDSQALPLHSYDISGALSLNTSSLLSAPFPTAKNIWASPRIQANNIIPPLVQMESVHPMYYSTAAITTQHPSSPPQNTQAFLHHMSPFPITSRSTPAHQNCQQEQKQHMQTSYSTPTIGTKQNTDVHHKSWPDVFLGGRDLFDTLPSRRVSVNTQFAFELHPNSTTTTAASSSASSPIIYGHTGPYHQQQTEKNAVGVHKYYNRLDHISQTSPFIYANAPISNATAVGPQQHDVSRNLPEFNI